jgi:hypothetical protein
MRSYTRRGSSTQWRGRLQSPRLEAGCETGGPRHCFITARILGSSQGWPHLCLGRRGGAAAHSAHDTVGQQGRRAGIHTSLHHHTGGGAADTHKKVLARDARPMGTMATVCGSGEAWSKYTGGAHGMRTQPQQEQGCGRASRAAAPQGDDVAVWKAAWLCRGAARALPRRPPLLALLPHARSLEEQRRRGRVTRPAARFECVPEAMRLMAWGWRTAPEGAKVAWTCRVADRRRLPEQWMLSAAPLRQ